MEKQIITQKHLERLVLDYCYDRDMCAVLNINYCDIRKKDIEKIRSYLLSRFEVYDGKGGDYN